MGNASCDDFLIIQLTLKNKAIYLGYIFAIFATIIWSGNFIIARNLNESVPPISLAFWRWMVAVIVFLPFALKALISQWNIIKKHLLYLSITSILGVTIFNTLIYFAGQTTTAINLSLISITFPVFIVIFSRIFLKESITLFKGLGIVIVIVGVLMLISKGDITMLMNTSFVIGDFWMLLASIIFATYSILIRNKPKELNILPFQLVTFILGLLFLFPFYIWEYTSTPSIELNITIITSILYVGIFASLVAFVLWNKAVASIGAVKSGLIYYTLPLFSGLLAFIFLNEEITMLHFYSMLLIVSGILIANYSTQK